MGRIVNGMAAAGLMAGALAGCGKTGTEQSAEVVGFGYGVDGQIVEDQWVYHRGQNRVTGDVRNVVQRKEFSHCREVGDTNYNRFSDSECWTDICCDESDYTHCEAVYETKFDFERQEEVKILDCPAPIERREVKPTTPVKNTECLNQRSEGQRINETAKYLIWVSTLNPKYDADKPQSGPEFLVNSQKVTDEQYWAVDRDTSLTVQVSGGKITSVDIPK